MPQGKPHEQRPWWFHSLGDRSIERHGDRWNSLFLDGPLDQPHGLIAYPSGRCQEYCFGPILFYHPGHLRSCPFYQCGEMSAGDMAHEREVPGRNSSNNTLSLKFRQSLNRKDHVDVLVSIPMVIIVVRNCQIRRGRIGGNLPEGGIPISILHVKWRLGA